METISSRRGFTLLEVLVALALLGVTLLGLAGTLTAAIGTLAAARDVDEALSSALAVGATARGAQAYERSPHAAGAPGGDGLPDTPDDLRGAVDCLRRELPVPGPSADWLWVEAACGAAAAEVLAGRRPWRRAGDLRIVGLLVRR